jgi:hypothetical protein
MTTPPVPDPAIVAAYQALSQALAGPTPTGAPSLAIPTQAQPTITDVQPPQAKAGVVPPTIVTITGTDLDTTVSVHVGKKQANNVAVVTATQVTFDTSGLPKGTARIAVMTNLGGVLSPKDFRVS